MANTCTVVWFRRDLRLEDNPALAAGVRAGIVVPVFIWSSEEEGQFLPGRVSRWWLKQSLIQLDQSLKSLGAPLILRSAQDSLTVLLEIVKDTGATQVFYNHLYDPVSLVRDHRVKQGLLQAGVVVNSFNADLLYEPWEVNDDEGKAFTTFAAYWQKCLSMPFEPEAPLLPPKRLVEYPGHICSSVVEDLELEDDSEKASNALLARAWSPGWSNADRALETFVNGPLLDYAANRQKADGATTSLLSPHLHYGELSVRKIFHHTRMKQVLWAKEGKSNGEQSVNLFLRSIGFREYSRYLSFNFPFTHSRSLLSNLKFFPWRVDEGYFKAWRQGRTGYPLVDAGMRELWATGWLHNRIRVIVSSFCVKFLQLPWRWGMKYFWDTLLDADLESDVLGWQYISGSLPDGHELDRMDNPQTEGYRFDPYGEYIRRWLPELSRLPTEWIHHPWDAPPSVLRAAGIELGSNYPRPIVEIAAARERLEQALSEMWEKEAADKAALANGSEEGLGDTMEVCGTDNVLLENVYIGRTSMCPNKEDSSGRSRHDQMVPSMLKENGKAVAGLMHVNYAAQAGNAYHQMAVARPTPGSPPVPVRDQGQTQRIPTLDNTRQGVNDDTDSTDNIRQRIPTLDNIRQGVNDDTDSTAESCCGRSGRNPVAVAGAQTDTMPVWSVSIQAQRVQEEARVPVVPDIRHGVLSRRHLHSLPMVNLEAMAATKTSSLSA